MKLIPRLGRRRVGAVSSSNTPERFRMSEDAGRLGNISYDDRKAEPASIVSVSVGSAGMRRTALWRRKMAALGCAGRIQSIVAYDCNRINVQMWVQAAEASGAMAQCILPEYVPFHEGFLRRPNSFISHYEPIERDFERIVEEMEQKSYEAGARPQLIIEWMGFGGHARLGLMLHEKIAERFPNAHILPVYCIPDERVLEQNIRDYDLWTQAQEIIGHWPAVITDNRVSGNLRALDERVATVLAAAEACYRFRPEAGTLSETASMFSIQGSRWLGLQVSDIPYHEDGGSEREVVLARFNAKLDPTRNREVRSAVTDVAQQVKEAIWRVAMPHNDEYVTGYMAEENYFDEQRIYCLLPFHPEITEIIKDDVEDQLQRGTFNGPFRGTKVHFAPGNANYYQRPTGFAYAHVCKIHGAAPENVPQSVTRVLEPTDSYTGARRRVLSRGEMMMEEMGILGDAPASVNGRSQIRDDYVKPAPVELPEHIGVDAEPLLELDPERVVPNL